MLFKSSFCNFEDNDMLRKIICLFLVFVLSIGVLSGCKGNKDKNEQNNENKSIEVEDVVFNTSEIEIEVGESVRINATVLPADATNTNLTWESSDSSVAEVYYGYVMGISVGKAVIVAKADNGKFETCLVSVIEAVEDDPEDDSNENQEPTPDDNEPQIPDNGGNENGTTGDENTENTPNIPNPDMNIITLKELRTNTAAYRGQKVSVEGIVIYNSNYTVYIEAYDAESDLYYGMQVFYGYNSTLHSVLAQGNKVRVVGVVSDFHGTWQISGLEYNPMKPNDPAYTAKLSDGHDVPFTEISVDKFYSDVTISLGEDENGNLIESTFKFTRIAVSTSVSMKNLKVIDVYTTKNGSSAGAMTLTCQVDGKEIDIRTEVLKDANGNIVDEQYFRGATIDVCGLIDYFDLNDTGNGTYQIKVYTLSDITLH